MIKQLLKLISLCILVKCIWGSTFANKNYKKYIEVLRGTCLDQTCYNFSDLSNSPLIECSYLDARFIECDKPSKRNASSTCKWGMTKFEDMPTANVTCQVLDNIECRGPRRFHMMVPCIKYTDKYFVSTLLYSIFLGIFAIDRCCIGHTGIGIGKLITLGGLGIWYMIDIILLVLDVIKPSDNSHWIPYY